MGCLPALSQTREVTVEQAKIVQVSSSEDSPNITQVTGNVTVIIYKCNNVTYCGSTYVGDRIDAYSLASTTTEPWYVPGAKPAPIALANIGTESDGMTVFNSSFTGMGSSLTGSSIIGPPDKTSILYGLYSASTKTDTFSGTNAYGPCENPQTSAIDLSMHDGTTLFSASNNPTAATFSASIYGISGALGHDHDNSINALGNDPAFGQIGVINSRTIGAEDYPWMDSAVRPPGDRLAASTPEGINSFLGTMQSFIPSFAGTASGLTMTLSQPVTYGSLSDLKPSGSLPDYSKYLNTASYSSSDAKSGNEMDTGLNLSKLPSNLATGFDKDSLMQQLEDLSKTNKKIVGWTIFIEEGQATN